MASFQAEIGQKTQRKRENKNCHSVPFRSVPTLRVIENSNKIVKKFKRLKNTIMASFQPKTGRKMLRMREYKNYRSIPTRREIENSKKIAKNSKS